MIKKNLLKHRDERLTHNKNYNEEGLKFCPKCLTYKNVEEFGKDKSRKDGLRIYCHGCEKIYNKKKLAVQSQKRYEKETEFLESVEFDKFLKIKDDILKDEEKISFLNETEKDDLSKEIEEVENKSTKDVERYDISIDNLAKMIVKQYYGDLNKADEIYNLFYRLIAECKDPTQGSKEALVKAIELRITASNNIAKVLELAVKANIEKEKKKKNKEEDFDIENIKKHFNRK